MHTGPVPESSGDLSGATVDNRECPKCHATEGNSYQIWESSDGAFEDVKYTCQTCKHVWWIDGIDS